jgi:hypothetical protein
LNKHRVTMATITPEERAVLCSRVRLPDLMEEDGADVREAGEYWLARIRPEDKTPSCRVWAPGKGRAGEKGWTYYDFGSHAGGDTVGYLTDPRHRGMTYLDAIRLLAERGGWTPPGLGTAGGSDTAPRTPPPPQPIVPTVPRMPSDDQADAVALFLTVLVQVDPEAYTLGKDYLLGRRCIPDVWHGGDVFMLRQTAVEPLTASLHAIGADAVDLLKRAGLMKEDGALAWWEDTALFVCRREDTAPIYLVGRRLHWKPGDKLKYLNQSGGRGVVRWPFNLPTVYASVGEDRRQDIPGLTSWPAMPKDSVLLVVEGAADALGAAALGWPAIAMLSRPQARDHKDRHSSCVKMLEPHLPILRQYRAVLVVPDADPGEKGAEGITHAANLAAALTGMGLRARTAALDELVLHASGKGKDLADMAAARVQS